MVQTATAPRCQTINFSLIYLSFARVPICLSPTPAGDGTCSAVKLICPVFFGFHDQLLGFSQHSNMILPHNSKKKLFSRSLSSFQCWWPAHSTSTWAGAAVKSALYRYAEQCAAPLLPPHDPDIRLWLFHQWCYPGGHADQDMWFSGASYCRRATSWHLSDFLQWANI